MSKKALAGYAALNQGNKELEAKNYPKAIESYNSSIESYKQAEKNELDKANFASAQVNLSIAWNETGLLELNTNQNIAKAIEAFKKAVAANPQSFSVSHNLGLVYQKAGQYKQAIDAFKVADKLKSDDFDTLYNLAECYKADGQNQDAIKTFQKSLTCKPNESHSLTIHSKIIESALLGNDREELNKLAKEAFWYAKKLSDNTQQSNKDQLNYISVNYGKLCLSESDKGTLHTVAQVFDKLNPSKTLLSTLVDYILHEYHANESEPKKVKIVKAEHELGYLIKYYDAGAAVTDLINQVNKVGFLKSATNAAKAQFSPQEVDRTFHNIETIKQTAALIASQVDATQLFAGSIAGIDVESGNATNVLGDLLIGFSDPV